MSVLKGLNPEKVFAYFEELTKIPHGSGNEKDISDYLVNFAKERQLKVIQDQELNVIIKKPATKGYEDAPTVIIQGHMDMVCEKNKDTNHNFEQDPLELKIDGDYIYANGTTLGADNGIAVAYGLAVIDSCDLQHPAIELFVTTGEETGMYGAIAVDPKNLDGKILLNIDSEEEGVFLVSCAGGVTNYVNIRAQWEKAQNEALKLEIKGLKGGHSGMEIIKQRGNANKLMGRLLNTIKKEVDFNICHISGGAKNNAIPRESEVTITVETKDIEKVKEISSKALKIFKTELRIQDPDINVTVEKTEMDKQLTKDVTGKIVTYLSLAPNGIQTMSEDIKGLVESSLNLGVIVFDEEKITFVSAIRSSIKTLKNEIMDRVDSLANLVGAEVVNDSNYPEWQYEPNSKIRDLCVATYKEINGVEPKIDAIHAGLECGLLKEKMTDVDMISFGPNLYDVHTPNEHMSISSVERMWNFTKQLLENIK
ncbi:aminoacyl-histidine dipeptidase [Clostridium sp.]|uniref:aminoacyl-histidine dipeptidase n=1 Tax=Clostridium sp. TaxID=1506 RepID=UPI00321648E9